MQEQVMRKLQAERMHGSQLQVRARSGHPQQFTSAKAGISRGSLRLKAHRHVAYAYGGGNCRNLQNLIRSLGMFPIEPKFHVNLHWLPNDMILR